MSVNAAAIIAACGLEQPRQLVSVNAAPELRPVVLNRIIGRIPVRIVGRIPVRIIDKLPPELPYDIPII